MKLGGADEDERYIATADSGGGAVPKVVGTDDPTRTSTRQAIEPSAPTRSPAEDRVPAPLQYRDPLRYHMLGEHGRGGLGRVFRARDKELGRDVAVKELLQRGTGAELRFFREALITARLEHPGIVPVHEAGRWPDGTPFYAMKLVAGRPLKALIDEASTLEARLALIPHVLAVADAIAYAHDRRIIHRDLKPANVMVGDFGETVVIDWGLAKDLRDTAAEPADQGPYRAPAAAGLTAAGSILGTPAYMAPEQLVGNADERSDIYALGGILFHVLTGASPHDRSGRDGPPIRRRPDVASNLPRDVLAIAERAMAPDPARRYPDARAFADDLRRFTQHRPVAARRYSMAARAALSFTRHRAVASILIAALMIAAVGATVFIRRILAERDRVSSALATAEVERDRAILANARTLITQDPTEAKRVLEAFRDRERSDAAMMLSTIAALPTADGTIRTTSSIGTAGTGPDLTFVAYTLVDSTVHVARMGRQGTEDLFTAQAHEGSPLAISPTASQAAFVDADLRLAVASLPSGATRTLSEPSSAAPIDIWFHGDHVLCSWSAASDRSVRCVDTHSGAAVFRSPLGLSVTDVVYTKGHALFAFCGSDSVLRRVVNARAEELGGCNAEATGLKLSESGRTLAVLTSPGHVRVIWSSQTRELTIPDDVEAIAIGDGPSVVFHQRSGHLGRLDVATGRTEDLPIDAVNITYVGVLAETDWPIIVRAKTEVVVFTGTGVRSFRGHSSPIGGVRLAATGRRFLTISLNEIRTWPIESGFSCDQVLRAPESLFHVALSPDGAQLYAEGGDGALHVVRAADGSSIARPGHSGLAFSLAVSTDGRFVATGGWDGIVVVWDADLQQSRSLTGHRGQVRDLAFVPGTHELISAGADGDVRSWELDTGAARVLFRHASEAYRLTIVAAGRLVLSTSSGGPVGVFDRTTGSVQFARGPSRNSIRAILVGDDVLASSLDGAVYRWSLASLGSPQIFRLAEGPSRALTYLSHRNLLVTTWGTSLVTSRPDGRVVGRHELPGSMIIAIAVSPDERYVAASTSSGDLFLLDLDRGEIALARATNATISWVTFDATATHLYATDFDGRLLRCDVQRFPMFPDRSYNSERKE